MSKIDLTQVTLGSDPEFFLTSKETGEFVSAEGIIGGTKDQPLQITAEGHMVQVDNVMLEINLPPANNALKFYRDLNIIFDYVKEKHKDLNIVITPSAEIPAKYLKTRNALISGCDPSFDIWTGKVAEAPKLSKSNVRYAGKTDCQN